MAKSSGLIFFTDPPSIWRANTDGSGLAPLIEGLVEPNGIVLAVEPPAADPVPALSPTGMVAALLLLGIARCSLYALNRRRTKLQHLRCK